MKFKTRIATLADMDTLIHLGRKTFLETYKGMGSDRPAGLEELYGRETFNEEKISPVLSSQSENTPVFILAFSRDLPVGFMKLEFDIPPKCVPTRNSVHFSQAYVLSEFQGQGIGRSFVEQASSHALNIKYLGLWLGVWDENKSAIKFYEKMGFNQVGAEEWKFSHKNIDYSDTDLIMFREIE